MNCIHCRQPLDDHCDGCCEDLKAGLSIKKFCGRKGNEVSRKPVATLEQYEKARKTKRSKASTRMGEYASGLNSFLRQKMFGSPNEFL